MGVFLFHAGTVVVTPEVNSPSLWDAGVEWGTAETEGANAYWQASPDPTPRTDVPKLCIGIAGRRVGTQGMSASWSLGRSDWFSQLAPTSATLTFVGVLDASPNDTVVISVESVATAEHSAVLWVGRVDGVSVEQQTDGSFWTTVTATDPIGVLGQAKMASSLGTGPIGTLQTLTESLSNGAGMRLTVDSDDSLPTIYGDPEPIDATVLEFINRMERTSNALLFQQGDGTLRAVIRQAFSAATIEAIPTTGLNAPKGWVERTDPTNVFNDFEFGGITGWTEIPVATDALTASQEAYGKRTLSVTDMLSPTSAAYSGFAGGVLLEPRPIASASFPIYSLEQDVLFLDPLDVLDKDGVLWQVMSVSHDVSPGQWSMSIEADSTQSQLVGTTDPGTVDPPPTTGRTTHSHTYTSVKSGVAFLNTDTGAHVGNGADDYLSVGYYRQDDTHQGKARAAIQFPVDWSDFPGFVRVKHAVMTLRTSGQTRVTFGSSPKFYAQRNTESWTEGSTTYPNDSNGSGITWPGPNATTSGQVLKSIGRTENNDITVDVTAIAQGWKDNGNYGLRLKSANEESHVNTTEFLSDDSAHPPTIAITCEIAI